MPAASPGPPLWLCRCEDTTVLMADTTYCGFVMRRFRRIVVKYLHLIATTGQETRGAVFLLLKVTCVFPALGFSYSICYSSVPLGRLRICHFRHWVLLVPGACDAWSSTLFVPVPHWRPAFCSLLPPVPGDSHSERDLPQLGSCALERCPPSTAPPVEEDSAFSLSCHMPHLHFLPICAGSSEKVAIFPLVSMDVKYFSAKRDIALIAISSLPGVPVWLAIYDPHFSLSSSIRLD